jgi:hypothetical protein
MYLCYFERLYATDGYLFYISVDSIGFSIVMADLFIVCLDKKHDLSAKFVYEILKDSVQVMEGYSIFC